VTWIVGGIGHFALVDVLTLHGRTRISEFIPHADLLDTMEKTTLSFGVLGASTAFLAAAGLEMLHNAFLVHDDIEDGSDRRRGVATMHRLGFPQPSAPSPPRLSSTGCAGRALATALFVLSRMRNES
jgi:hypothetical protein